MVLGAFLKSLILRPVCRSLTQRSLSWIALEVHAAVWSLATGSSAAIITSRFIMWKPDLVELLEACAKTSVLLFLWCNLYFSIKQLQRHAQERERLLPAKVELLGLTSTEYASRFAVRDRVADSGRVGTRFGMGRSGWRLLRVTHAQWHSSLARNYMALDDEKNIVRFTAAATIARLTSLPNPGSKKSP